VSFSPDGTHIVCGSGDKTVRFWDTITGAIVVTLEGHSASICSVNFSPDGLHIVSVDDKGLVIVWDMSIQNCISGMQF
jgi:WD40 repeat protein